MIVYVKGEAVGMPVDQRAEVVRATPSQLVVILQGNERAIIVNNEDVVGLELSDQVSMKFKQTGLIKSTFGSPYPT